MAEIDRTPREEAILAGMIEGTIPVVSRENEEDMTPPEIPVESYMFLGFLGQYEAADDGDQPFRNISDSHDWETEQFILLQRGVDWLAYGDDEGSFLSTISDAEEERLHSQAGKPPDRSPVSIADLFPEEWRGEQIVYEIIVRARKLTENGQPIPDAISREVDEAEDAQLPTDNLQVN